MFPPLDPPNPIWRTRDGKLVAVRDMDDHHLLSTIRVLRGISPIGTTFSTTAEKRREWLNVMANEAYRRELTIDPLTEEEMARQEEGYYVHE